MANEVIKPDIKFVKEIISAGGGELKKCFQCATCSVTCKLSPDDKPFPRKEMIWAQWGIKEKLLNNPDIWLCYQCRDCTTYCPRGAKPSETLSAIRRLAIVHYGFPNFLAKWSNKPRFLPVLFFISTLILSFAILAREAIEKCLGIENEISQKIVFASTTMFPHWLLNTLFLSISGLVFIILLVGGIRFFLAMKHTDGRPPAKGFASSIFATIRKIITHNEFRKCTTEERRFFSHICVFFGFIALSYVTIWVITISINPLFQKGFIYPFNFLNPLKIIANLGGCAIITGCLLMILSRLKQTSSTYFDWIFIFLLLFIAITGFMTEILHYFRIDELRYPVYFSHLVLVLTLLIYLPYSKFSHFLYRTIALVYNEYYGKNEDK